MPYTIALTAAEPAEQYLLAINGASNADGVLRNVRIPSASNEKFTFSGLGLKYDANNILAIAEFTKYDVDNTRDLINTEGYYLTGGYRFKRLMPHITYGRMYNPDDGLSRAASKSDQTTVTAGLRYELNTKIAIKAEVSKIDGFNGTSGLFDPEEGVSLEDSAKIYSIVVDAIF
jgi:predicted porin